MSKVTYSSLKLKPNDEVKTFKIGDKEIEVKQYLSSADKLDLVDITLQKSKRDNIYNSILTNIYFHLNLVYLYTNITFTEKQKEDELKLYDCLDNAGIIDNVVANIPEKEYTDLLNKMEEQIDLDLKYNTSTAAIINKVINDLPAQTEVMKDIINQFDPQKYQAVIDFAKAANGGREIDSNQ